MTYQVLARKWRPQNFSQIVGQQHVVQSLLHGLQHDRLHHAYLFTGTRGVGKTTIARILAKAINCEDLQDYNPCGLCAVCQDFAQGRFMDLIEVDAASRTKVEDTRDLLDNAQYAPNQGRYKVYLIDEVHMLSTHSFNALLKTLEEPPAHVKFLLATTDPHKIPVTVLSRCLQFNLKRLLPDQVAGQMQFILGQEQIHYEPAAIQLLARAADGSMRDGLSLLDQAIAFGNGAVHEADVTAMLGVVAQQPVDSILQALVARDGLSVMQSIDQVAALTPDFSDLLQQILRILHRVAIVQHIPDFVDQDFDVQMIKNLAQQLSAEDVQLFYQIALLGQRDLEWSPDPRMALEMVLLRMLTFQPHNGQPPHNVVTNPASVAANIQSHIMPSQSAVADQKQLAPLTPAAPVSLDSSSAQPVATQAVTGDDWADIIQATRLRGMSRELANNCVLDRIDDTHCYLLIDPGQSHLLGGKSEGKLQAALQAYFARPIKLKITPQAIDKTTPAVQYQQAQVERQQAAVDAIHSDPHVKYMQSQFDARILSGTIEPNDD